MLSIWSDDVSSDELQGVSRGSTNILKRNQMCDVIVAARYCAILRRTRELRRRGSKSPHSPWSACHRFLPCEAPKRRTEFRGPFCGDAFSRCRCLERHAMQQFAQKMDGASSAALGQSSSRSREDMLGAGERGSRFKRCLRHGVPDLSTGCLAESIRAAH